MNSNKNKLNNKISGSQMDPKITKTKVSCNGANLKFYFAVLVLVYLIMESISIELDNHIIFQGNQ